MAEQIEHGGEPYDDWVADQETCAACGQLKTYHDDGECPPADVAPEEGFPIIVLAEE